jgi:hypothetical protein
MSALAEDSSADATALNMCLKFMFGITSPQLSWQDSQTSVALLYGEME